MFNSRVFKFRYLVALILLVVMVAAVGNAAALTIGGDHNVVEGGLNTYTADTATITYSINTDGTVVAQATLGEAYDAVSASFDGGIPSGTYSPCSPNGGSTPDTVWDCTITDPNGATGIWLVAAHD